MHTISILPAFSDNFIYVIHNGSSAAVIDPSAAYQVSKFLKENNLGLETVLITHHHSDHTGGVGQLKKETGCTVIGGGSRMGGGDSAVSDGDERESAGLSVRVIGVPGHTNDHVAYYIPSLKAVFTGDALFSAGCGRLFEGSAKQMYTSLQKLAALDDDTLVYCGHEYTDENLQFAAMVDPGNEYVKEKLEAVRDTISQGGYSVPSTIAEEKKTNPFLRAGELSIRKYLHMERASDVEVFAELRNRKDRFYYPITTKIFKK